MSKRILSAAVIFSMLVGFASFTVNAQDAAALVQDAAKPAGFIPTFGQLAAGAAPIMVAHPAQNAVTPAQIAAGAAPAPAPQPQVQNNAQQVYRPVSPREFFGFDGIPFNGSHMAAFLRWHTYRRAY